MKSRIPYIIRNAKIEDIPLLYRLEQQVFVDTDGILNTRAFHYQITKHNSLILVAKPLEDENSLYGYILVLRHRKSARIYSLAVDSRMQNLGIARSLIQAALDQLNHPMMKKINLEVRESNIPAVNLYHSLGFVRTNQKRDYYAPNEHAIVMVRTIDNQIFRESLVNLEVPVAQGDAANIIDDKSLIL